MEISIGFNPEEAARVQQLHIVEIKWPTQIYWKNIVYDKNDSKRYCMDISIGFNPEEASYLNYAN